MPSAQTNRHPGGPTNAALVSSQKPRWLIATAASLLAWPLLLQRSWLRAEDLQQFLHGPERLPYATLVSAIACALAQAALIAAARRTPIANLALPLLPIVPFSVGGFVSFSGIRETASACIHIAAADLDPVILMTGSETAASFLIGLQFSCALCVGQLVGLTIAIVADPESKQRWASGLAATAAAVFLACSYLEGERMAFVRLALDAAAATSVSSVIDTTGVMGAVDRVGSLEFLIRFAAGAGAFAWCIVAFLADRRASVLLAIAATALAGACWWGSRALEVRVFSLVDGLDKGRLPDEPRALHFLGQRYLSRDEPVTVDERGVHLSRHAELADILADVKADAAKHSDLMKSAGEPEEPVELMLTVRLENGIESTQLRALFVNAARIGFDGVVMTGRSPLDVPPKLPAVLVSLRRLFDFKVASELLFHGSTSTKAKLAGGGIDLGSTHLPFVQRQYPLHAHEIATLEAGEAWPDVTTLLAAIETLRAAGFRSVISP